MIAFGQHHQPDSPSVADLIAEAIEATGGREQLLSYSAITWQERGVYSGGPTQIDYVGDYAVQFPNRYRMRVKGAFTIVVDDSEGWINNSGAISPLPETQMREYREANHAIWAMQLHPLLDDESFELRRIWDHESVDDQLLGVRVSHREFRDLDLYFDPDMLLLCKSIRKGVAAEFSASEVTMETTYCGHSRVEGILLPSHMTVHYDGRKILESTTGNYQLHADLDEMLFRKPTL